MEFLNKIKRLSITYTLTRHFMKDRIYMIIYMDKYKKRTQGLRRWTD